MGYVMNKKLLVLLTSLMVCIGAQAASVRTVLVGTQADNPGLSYIDEHGVLTGFEVEVLREINRRTPGVKFEYRTMDFAMLFVSLGTKKVQLINSNIKKSAEREKQFLYTTEDFYRTPFKLVIRSNDPSIHAFRDLAGKKIAVLGTGVQAKVLNDYLKKNNLNVDVLPSKSNTEMVSLLNTGRVDALFLPEHQVNVFNRYRKENLKAIGKGLIPADKKPNEFGAYFLVQKGDTVLRDELDKALRSMKKDGTLKKLSLKWFGEDFTVPFQIEK
jgi:ABC-type amino acid transport substrate-binding protein